MARQREFTDARVSRRQFVQGIGASGLLTLGLASTPDLGQAATPRAGGIARIRGRDPLGWDPMLTVSPRTHVAVSFTHNRLFRHKSGPEVPIGTMIVEPDLVERWEEPSDTRYIFHLRQGVRWHDKPPVGGRELVAEDVRYSLERFLNVKGNSNRSLLADITAVKVLGKYIIQLDLSAPNVWFLDYLAEASTLPIIAKEAVEKFKTMKQPEAVIGTGPWMLAAYTPGTQAVFRKHPAYFRAGLPYLDEVHLLIIDDDVTATAAYMAGQLDFGPSLHHSIRGSEMQEFREKHPDWYYKGFRPNLHAYLAMRTDQAPFKDQRVRQAISMAINREVIQSRWRRSDTAVPASFTDWHLPVDQVGEGAKYYAYNPEESRRLLHEAGYPQGFQTSVLVHSATSSQWADYIERVASWLRDIGITAQIIDKEYGAFIRLLMQRKYDGMVLSANRPFVVPDGFIYWRYLPGDPRNMSYVEDAKMLELAQTQRREKDAKKRKAIFDELSRLAAVNQYYIHFNSWPRIATWRPYVQNFNTNLGYDYGGPLESAWFATF
jgi:peptide/nickel transport system substrate-binding protein